jgi:hypothetical protein
VKIYVAGPMRGIPHFNFPAFDEAAGALETLGHEVFNPAQCDRAKYGDSFADGAIRGESSEVPQFDLRDALADDLNWIARNADAVAVLDGWEKSSGARAEVALAHALGLIVAPWGVFSWHGAGVAYTQCILPPDVAPIAPTGEVRTTSTTGGEKGVKLARFDLVPAGPLRALAEHYGRGASKYDDHQWRKGYEWSKSFAAMQRHAWAWWDGEDVDAEIDSPHLAAVAWHAFALLQYAADCPQFDDRPGRVA